MTSFSSQLRIMLWKNWTLQLKVIKNTIIYRTLLPLFFPILLLLIRFRVGPKVVTEVTYYPIKNLSIFDKGKFFNPALVKVGYTPQGREVDKLMGHVKDLFKEGTPGVHSTFKGYSSVDSMESDVKSDGKHFRHCLEFLNVDNTMRSLPKQLKFAVRPHSTMKLLHTKNTYSILQDNSPRSDSGDNNLYEKRGVLFLQRLVGEALIKYWLSHNGRSSKHVRITAYSQRFAYPPHNEDPIVIVLKKILGIIIFLTFLHWIMENTKNLVLEKEQKIKESVKLMGLKASVYWTSWFITLGVMLLPLIILFTIILALDFNNEKKSVLPNSDKQVIFVLFLCFGLSLITFVMMVSSFVQRARIGSILSGLLSFVMFIPFMYMNMNYDDYGKASKMTVCLLFNCAIGFAASVISIHEGTGDGVQWDNFHKPATKEDNISVLDCMIMLILDSFIHLLIFWYLDNVRPGDFGVPKPLCFCFSPSYWYGAKTATNIDLESTGETKNSRFEKEPSNLKVGIRIMDLRKVFGPKNAVNGISLNMYENQIFVLLGHNGAGKTTTMSMLTGFFPPTKGTAIVNGCDIRKDIDGVRNSLGLCPQHNVLFDGLTVMEHLQFFGALKGIPRKQAETEILMLVKEVDLENKLNSKSVNLSGGQKRKLSVAIALIGGSKVVILDEPSAGMDPSARRMIWDVLQNHREGCTMILTTHYMDEADVVGDRIAIMSEGVVKCCGTSMFLKKLYGTGYHLVIVKDPSCNVHKLTKVITSHIEHAKLETIVNLEITYLLPEKDTGRFPALFNTLDNNKSQLGIVSFGTTATTLEEVFLTVGKSSTHHDKKLKSSIKDQKDKTTMDGSEIIKEEKEEEREENEENENGQDETSSALEEKFDSADELSKSSEISGSESDDSNEETSGEKNAQSTNILDFNKGYTKETGLSLEFNRMRAIFVKKVLNTWRNRIFTLGQVLAPAALLLCVVSFGKASEASGDIEDPSLTFNLEPFDDTIVPTTDGYKPTNNDKKLQSIYDQQFGTEIDVQPFRLSHKYPKYDNYTVELGISLDIRTFNRRVIVGLETGKEMPGTKGTLNAISHYNGQPYHAEPIGVNYMMNAFLQFYVGRSYSLQSSVDPLPLDVGDEDVNKNVVTSSYGHRINLYLAVGLAVLTTLCITFLITERKVGAKQLQVVCGVNPFSYWIPTFLWDFILCFISSLFIPLIFACFQINDFNGETRWLIVILILVMYIWAMLPCLYFLQFFFHEPSSGFNYLLILQILSGMFTLIAKQFLDDFSDDLGSIPDIVNYIFMALLPNYSMARAVIELSNFYTIKKTCDGFVCQHGESNLCCKDSCRGDDCSKHQFGYLACEIPGVGIFLVFMAVQGLAYFILVILIDYDFFHNIRSKPSQVVSLDTENIHEDSDVVAERNRIINTPLRELFSTDPLLLYNLYKQYGQFVAVNHIYVGIPQQECFGLLGENGAGKTTTFKMLTGGLRVSGGNAYLAGYGVKENTKKVQTSLGYCPQFDALHDQMTARETLVMYARLRGIPEENIPQVVDNLINILLLQADADKCSGIYSGGNKRKLSTAIALVGDPQFVMLDEPSAGMDPKARRQLWNVLSQVRASGRTLVLTSHSMEECDALCTLIAIMVNGQFMCLGSPQYLKNKFAQGYTLIVQMKTMENGIVAPAAYVADFVTEEFPGTKVFDNHQGYVHFQVPSSKVKLSQVFNAMEAAKTDFYVRDYSVHETTLEQVFLSFTHLQKNPEEMEQTKTKSKTKSKS